MTATSGTEFFKSGMVTDHINVQISFQIIGLFSEGLYSSSSKAIEELVSNAFDADATCVHTVISHDRATNDASIAILDNGTGMDAEGLKVHWIVGNSIKASHRKTSRGRRTIGKFGIGKLAAYVLGKRLTHISKSDGRFFSTTMDFETIPKPKPVTDHIGESESSTTPPVELELRELTENEAQRAVRPWLSSDTGRESLVFFGDEAEDSWTVAIITELKPMAVDLSINRLRWILSTAMPLRDDFSLYLNGNRVVASKAKVEPIGRWTLGKDILTIPNPAPKELEPEIDEHHPETEYQHFLLTDAMLGPVSGYLELYEDPIDGGKSGGLGRSNGFFVYVCGRLISIDDSGFGIDRNKLRHGTFSRFRLVVNIDRLDDELRSSRETLLNSPLVERAQHLLQGLFNMARSKLDTHQAEVLRERRVSERFADSPASLTERPIQRMVVGSYEGRVRSRFLTAVDKKEFPTVDELVTFLESRISDGRGLIGNVVYEDLGTQSAMSKLDSITGKLSINLEHPYVAHFADEFSDDKSNLPLELFATAEILLEASLYDMGVGAAAVETVFDTRDELLRYLARSSGTRNSITVANELMESLTSARGLELALVEVFQQLGFEAIPKAKKDEQDGLAEAFLPNGDNGKTPYRVSLEAKSKQKPGGKVKKSGVEVSTIARHRDEAYCDYAIVVGPDFETGSDDLGAVIREIKADREANPTKGITLMRAKDLAKLVRLAPIKRVNLETIRTLLDSCQSPSEAEEWVKKIESSQPKSSSYRQILEAVWEIQQNDEDHTVEYGALRSALRFSKNLKITDMELREECRALSRMASGYFVARDDRVELNIRPNNVMTRIHEYVADLPKADAEQV